jgi:hypothetical protein
MMKSLAIRATISFMAVRALIQSLVGVNRMSFSVGLGMTYCLVMAIYSLPLHY